MVHHDFCPVHGGVLLKEEDVFLRELGLALRLPHGQPQSVGFSGNDFEQLDKVRSVSFMSRFQKQVE